MFAVSELVEELDGEEFQGFVIGLWGLFGVEELLDDGLVLFD